VGTEHILLALLADGEGTAGVVLRSSGATYEGVRAAVIRMMGLGVDPDPDPDPGSGSGSGSGSGEPMFTGPAQDVIELARREASRLGRDQAGTEHVLLALVEERGGAAARILLQLDADPVAIRSALSS
jgi:ATP-dependent Clp protease ATP-binding subunit ClpC